MQNICCSPFCLAVDRQNIVATNQYWLNSIMHIKINLFFLFVVIIIV